ncbi:MAG: hypothetical protein ACRD03_15245 [Acidimicrobiales bacterium]
MRVLPDTLLVWSLPLLALLLLVQYGWLWRNRRLVNRVAARLAGPPPRTRLERRAARAAAADLIGSPDGTAERAARLGTTPERLASEERRWSVVVYASMAVLLAVVLVVVLFPGVLDRWMRSDRSSDRAGPAITGVALRTAIRQIVAFTQGVRRTNVPDSGIRRGSTLDRFSATDVAAMKLMSGCGSSTPIPRG